MADALPINLEAPCWLSERYLDRDGYSHVRVQGRMFYAHRHIWEILRGPIPQGLEIDHLCRVRNCVNPQHLEVVTHRINLLRGNGFPGIEARRSDCGQGHEYTVDSLRINPDGSR